MIRQVRYPRMSRGECGNRTQEVVGSKSQREVRRGVIDTFGVQKLFSGVRVSFPMRRSRAGKARRFVQCRLTSMKIRR
jgi:ABC-type branched-subunit amino acid transport system ATPase component